MSQAVQTSTRKLRSKMVMNEKLVKVGERAAMQEVCALVSCWVCTRCGRPTIACCCSLTEPVRESAVLSLLEHVAVWLLRPSTT
jgi:hypothetical protein